MSLSELKGGAAGFFRDLGWAHTRLKPLVTCISCFGVVATALHGIRQVPDEWVSPLCWLTAGLILLCVLLAGSYWKMLQQRRDASIADIQRSFDEQIARMVSHAHASTEPIIHILKKMSVLSQLQRSRASLQDLQRRLVEERILITEGAGSCTPDQVTYVPHRRARNGSTHADIATEIRATGIETSRFGQPLSDLQVEAFKAPNDQHLHSSRVADYRQWFHEQDTLDTAAKEAIEELQRRINSSALEIANS
jgi:hypothetical protein